MFIGFAIGLLSTWFFWKYMLSTKPQLVIADHVIASGSNEPGQKTYRFTLRNTGKNQIIDIAANAWICDLAKTQEREYAMSLYQLPIYKSDTLTLGTKNYIKNPWELPDTFLLPATPDRDMGSEVQWYENVR